MVVPKKLTAIIILLGRNLSTVHTQITLRFKALVIILENLLFKLSQCSLPPWFLVMLVNLL